MNSGITMNPMVHLKRLGTKKTKKQKAIKKIEKKNFLKYVNMLCNKSNEYSILYKDTYFIQY